MTKIYSAKNLTTIMCFVLFLSSSVAYGQYTITKDDVTIKDNQIETYHYSGLDTPPTDIIIPNIINGITIKSIGYRSFYGKNLNNVAIEEGIINIDDYAFGNNNLTTIDIPKTVTKIGWGSFSSNQLTQVTMHNGLEIIESYSFWDNNISSIDLPSTINKIGNSVFNKNNLTVINGEATNGIIYAINNDGSFDKTRIIGYGGTATFIDFISENTLTIESGAFESCGLTGVVLPANIRYIAGQAFYGNKLTSIVLPSNLDSIGNAAFSNNLITSITFNDKISSIANSAFSSNAIKTMALPNSIKNIGDFSFYSNKISNLSLPDTATIGNSAFSYNSLSSISIPGGIKIINKLAFSNNNITNVDFKEGVETIREAAFFSNDIDDIKFPVSLLKIEIYAFYDNTLDTIVLNKAINSNGDKSYAWKISTDTTTLNDTANSILAVYNYKKEYTALFSEQKGAVDIKQELSSDNIIIYPNPTTEYFAINGVDEPIKYIDILNINGALKIHRTLDYIDKSYIDVTSLKKGYYFIRIVTKDNKIYNKKILID